MKITSETISKNYQAIVDSIEKTSAAHIENFNKDYAATVKKAITVSSILAGIGMGITVGSIVFTATLLIIGGELLAPPVIIAAGTIGAVGLVVFLGGCIVVRILKNQKQLENTDFEDTKKKISEMEQLHLKSDKETSELDEKVSQIEENQKKYVGSNTDSIIKESQEFTKEFDQLLENTNHILSKNNEEAELIIEELTDQEAEKELIIQNLTTLINQELPHHAPIKRALREKDFNLTLRWSASVTTTKVLAYLLENRKILNIDIHAKGEKSGSALDIATKKNKLEHIALLQKYIPNEQIEKSNHTENTNTDLLKEFNDIRICLHNLNKI